MFAFLLIIASILFSATLQIFESTIGRVALQPVGPCKGCELATLIGVHDVGRAELVYRLVQRIDAEVCFQRVRDTPCQNL